MRAPWTPKGPESTLYDQLTSTADENKLRGVHMPARPMEPFQKGAEAGRWFFDKAPSRNMRFCST